MDGRQIKASASLQMRLSLSLSLVILAVALVAGAFSFYAAFDEAHEWQDNVLRQVVVLSGEQHPIMARKGRGATMAKDMDNDPIIVQFIRPTQVSSKNSMVKDFVLPDNLPEGIQTVQIGKDTYRIFIKNLGSGERLAVVQSTGERDEMARDGALRTLLPFLILVPVLLFIIGKIIRQILAPVTVVAGEIDTRKELELHPIVPDMLPIEIRPFVIAINRLFDRIRQSMELQRRFVADAAHELRSPLTALSLQAERLANTELSVTAQERLADLREGIERSRILLNQLLAFARAQATVDQTVKPVSVQHIFRLVLENLMPLAEVKDIDIGVVGATDVKVNVSEMDLITLIRNLVTNAIQYIPPGGRIDLSVEKTSKGVVINVKDNGPGISDEERKRVFDPFYRILGNDETGSGLGLSIVQAIADRIGAIVRLENSDNNSKTGLSVTVVFCNDETSWN